jgi:NTP pyrophosphatase (non-canonical NTP hydrolase)
MDIVEVGKKVYRFQKERVMELGVELTPELVFFHLSEEIGEIARQLVNKNLSMREYEESNLKEEIAQTILDILVLSQLFNIDLPEALNKKMNEMAKKAAGSSISAGGGTPTLIYRYYPRADFLSLIATLLGGFSESSEEMYSRCPKPSLLGQLLGRR